MTTTSSRRRRCFTMRCSSSLLLVLLLLVSTTAAYVDGRWKSTKLTQKEKAEMGLYPPPGEEWPADIPVGGDTGGGDGAAGEPTVEAGEGTLSVVDTVKEEHAIEEVLEQDAAAVSPLLDEEDPSEGDAFEIVDDPPGSDEAMDEDPLNEPPGEEPEDEPEETEKAAQGSRRKFVSYTPSKFESMWIKNIPKLENGHLICDRLVDGKHQTAMMHKLLDFMCTAPLLTTGWCYWHDHNHYVWYNKANTKEFEIYIDETPQELKYTARPDVSPNDREDGGGWDAVASKFTFLDETTGEEYHEYIEPLVGHLRFPLAGCYDDKPLLNEFASFVIPPPTLSRVEGRTIMLDVGSEDWSRMEYIVEEWEARDAGFAFLLSYSPAKETEDAFLTTVPKHHQSKIFRQYFEVVDAPTTKDNEVYLPTEIALDAHEDDYVMLKLDRRMHANLKQSILENILQTNIHVDEIFWEINAKGNYIFQTYFEKTLKFAEVADLELHEAYAILKGLREKGIRAHAWI